MHPSLRVLAASLTLAAFLPSQPGQAQTAAEPSNEHDAHHPAQENAPPASGGGMGPGMMQEMMQGMMSGGRPMMGGQAEMPGGGMTMHHPAPGVVIIINGMGAQAAMPGLMGQDGTMHGMMGPGGTMQGMAGPGGAPMSPSAAAYAQVTAQMHQAMDVQFTGDPDGDFARAMIPHHQGAIDMAKIALEYGKDPQIRELANAVIEAQEKEITMLREWLAKNPQR